MVQNTAPDGRPAPTGRVGEVASKDRAPSDSERLLPFLGACLDGTPGVTVDVLRRHVEIGHPVVLEEDAERVRSAYRLAERTGKGRLFRPRDSRAGSRRVPFRRPTTPAARTDPAFSPRQRSRSRVSSARLPALRVVAAGLRSSSPASEDHRREQRARERSAALGRVRRSSRSQRLLDAHASSTRFRQSPRGQVGT
jgi:hypothetical protein